MVVDDDVVEDEARPGLRAQGPTRVSASSLVASANGATGHADNRLGAICSSGGTAAAHEICAHLQRGWNADASRQYGDWSTVRPYASEGFNRGRSTLGSGAARADSTLHNAGSAVGNAADRAAAGAQNLGHKAANAADDLKDRVDGNPASKPGPDATDSPRRFDSR